jgi:hypothetical protein
VRSDDPTDGSVSSVSSAEGSDSLQTSTYLITLTHPVSIHPQRISGSGPHALQRTSGSGSHPLQRISGSGSHPLQRISGPSTGRGSGRRCRRRRSFEGERKGRELLREGVFEGRSSVSGRSAIQGPAADPVTSEFIYKYNAGL